MMMVIVDYLLLHRLRQASRPRSNGGQLVERDPSAPSPAATSLLPEQINSREKQDVKQCQSVGKKNVGPAAGK